MCYVVKFKDQKKQKIICDKNYNPSNTERLNTYFTLVTRIQKMNSAELNINKI